MTLYRGRDYSGRHATFKQTIVHKLQVIVSDLVKSSESAGGKRRDEIFAQSKLFMEAIDDAFELAERNQTDKARNSLFWTLRDAFINKELKGLTQELKFSFQAFMARSRFSPIMEKIQAEMLDFRFPQEWFPATRTMQRKIHVHVGPTNSGKTYNALQALEKSKNGVYAGPLRLLATEVYQRLNAKGRACALITGEEVRVPEDTDQYLSSCTVEMVPMNTKFDVAVIDEIQMIADRDRGGAWTSALLGVQADEVHLCGEERTVKLIEAICAGTGDQVFVHRYERLSPLNTMDEPIKPDFSNLQKGDAVVAFSRLALHALKRTIEMKTRKRCAIVYGSLPPEVRVQQAALFNDPNNDYDYIVASDAIGMGLNLNIRRVVLESITKFDGSQNRLLSYPEIRQIGGRAGRYRTATSAIQEAKKQTNIEQAHQEATGKRLTLDDRRSIQKQLAEVDESSGWVTTLDMQDLRAVRRAFTRSVSDLDQATIQPPAGVVERYASYFPPNTPLSFILQQIRSSAVTSDTFNIHVPSDLLEIADIIQDIPLTIFDRLTFCFVPVSLRGEQAIPILRALASIVANNSEGDLLAIKEIPLEILDIDPSTVEGGYMQYLHKLESLHVGINQYIWLSYRYSGMFRSQPLAFHVRSLVEEKLIETLDKLDFTPEEMETRRKKKRRMAKVRERRTGIVQDEDGDADLDIDAKPVDEVKVQV